MSRSSVAGRSPSTGGAVGHGLPSTLPIAGVLGKRHERELDGCHVDGARCRLAAGADRGRAAAQGDDGERELLRPVGTNAAVRLPRRESGSGAWADSRPRRRARACSRASCRRPSRCAGTRAPRTAIPSATGSPSPRWSLLRRSARGPPGGASVRPGRTNRRHREGRRRHVRPRTARAGRDPRPTQRGGTGTAGRPGARRRARPRPRGGGDERALPGRAPSPPTRGARRGGRASERGRAARSLEARLRKAVGIDLVMGRERRAVVGSEVLPYQRMVDRRRPLVVRGARVGTQAVVQPRDVAGSHAAESLIPAGERLALPTSRLRSTGSPARQHSLVGREMAPPDGLRGSEDCPPATRRPRDEGGTVAPDTDRRASCRPT